MCPYSSISSLRQVKSKLQTGESSPEQIGDVRENQLHQEDQQPFRAKTYHCRPTLLVVVHMRGNLEDNHCTRRKLTRCTDVKAGQLLPVLHRCTAAYGVFHNVHATLSKFLWSPPLMVQALSQAETFYPMLDPSRYTSCSRPTLLCRYTAIRPQRNSHVRKDDLISLSFRTSQEHHL